MLRNCPLTKKEINTSYTKLTELRSAKLNQCYAVVQSSLVILSSRVFCSCGVRWGKKFTPVTLSMSLIGVRENLSNLDVGEGS